MKNLIKKLWPTPRPVTLEEVAQHAKPSHKACRGQGHVTFVVGDQRVPAPCSCAAERFKQAHANRIEPRDGGFVWKPDEAQQALLGMRVAASALLGLGLVAGSWGLGYAIYHLLLAP